MIITFSGVDCAGKSTQIELLRQYFISQGKTVTVFWYRPGYSDEMQKIKDCIRTGLKWVRNARKAKTSEHKREENTNTPQAQTHTIPAPLWLVTALCDTTAQWALKLRWLSQKYDVVICDRYVEDARLDLQMKYPQYFWPESVLKHIAKAFPKPDCSILLWLPFDEMNRRVNEKNEPFPDDERTRQMRYRAYEFAVDEGAYTVIDTSGLREETHAKIVETVERKE